MTHASTRLRFGRAQFEWRRTQRDLPGDLAPLEEQREFAHREPGGLAVRAPRRGEPALLEPLREDAQAGAVPVQDLGALSIARDAEEQAQSGSRLRPWSTSAEIASKDFLMSAGSANACTATCRVDPITRAAVAVRERRHVERLDPHATGACSTMRGAGATSGASASAIATNLGVLDGLAALDQSLIERSGMPSAADVVFRPRPTIRRSAR
jgi:hypothetical protein